MNYGGASFSTSGSPRTVPSSRGSAAPEKSDDLGARPPQLRFVRVEPNGSNGVTAEWAGPLNGEALATLVDSYQFEWKQAHEAVWTHTKASSCVKTELEVSHGWSGCHLTGVICSTI